MVSRPALLERELFADLFKELRDLHTRIAGAERFDRQETAIAGFLDDRLHPSQVGGDLFSARPDGLLELPGDRIGDQFLNLRVGIALAKTPDVQDGAEPL